MQSAALQIEDVRKASALQLHIPLQSSGVKGVILIYQLFYKDVGFTKFSPVSINFYAKLRFATITPFVSCFAGALQKRNY